MNQTPSFALRLRSCFSTFAAAITLICASSLSIPLFAADPPPAEPPKNTVRLEIAAPLRTAQDLIREKKFAEALVEVANADAVPMQTPYETYLIQHMRGVAAANSGKNEMAAKALEAVLATGQAPAADVVHIHEALAQIYRKAKNYKNAAASAIKALEGNAKNTDMHAIYAHASFMLDDYPSAIRESKIVIAADEAAGKKPTETQLRVLASSYSKAGDKAGYASAIEKLVTLYPTREYWTDLVFRTENNPKFSDRLLLDSYRLKLYAGLLNNGSEYTEMAETAMQAGYAIEAQKVLEAAAKPDVQRSANDIARQKKLLETVGKDAAEEKKRMARGEASTSKTALALVNNGFNFVLNGDFAKGLPMMEEGVKMSGLKYPEDAKLRLGVAYVFAGEKDKAVAAFGNVKGEDGTAELAQLWSILVRQPPKS